MLHKIPSLLNNPKPTFFISPKDNLSQRQATYIYRISTFQATKRNPPIFTPITDWQKSGGFYIPVIDRSKDSDHIQHILKVLKTDGELGFIQITIFSEDHGLLTFGFIYAGLAGDLRESLLDLIIGYRIRKS